MCQATSTSFELGHWDGTSCLTVRADSEAPEGRYGLIWQVHYSTPVALDHHQHFSLVKGVVSHLVYNRLKD